MHLRLAFGSIILGAALAVGLAQGGNSSNAGPELRYGNGVFRIVNGKETTRVSIQTSTKEVVARPPERLLFRKDDVFVVWDARGLSIRKGSRVKTTRLEDAATSPKLFSEEDIYDNYTLLLAGVIQRGASRCIGAKRVGNSVYLLVEWQTEFGDPWLQALFEVDLSDAEPTASLIPGLPGEVLNVTDDWDRLLLTTRGLVAFVDGDQGWGRAVLNSRDNTIIFERMGTGLVEVRKRSDSLAHYKSKTDYGSLVMGQVPIAYGNAVPLIESKGNVRLLDSETPWLFIEADQKGRDLHNSETGAERMIPSDTGIARTSKGILVWSPQKNPTFAELLDTSRMEVIARWTTELELKLRDQEATPKKGAKKTSSSKKKPTGSRRGRKP